jgi:tRNA (guanine37-N1)-methyltransferase
VRVDVLTLFPEMFSGPLETSILKRAREAGHLDVRFCNFRDFSTDKHHTVDDSPFGGGPGMVLKAEPLFLAVESLRREEPAEFPLVYMSPKGRRFDQALARELAALPRFAVLCGHYEGVDQRVLDHLVNREVSVGDFIVTGGELPCMLVLDAVARLVPGVLGDAGSLEEESFSSGLLEYPQYTRPAEFRGWKVPEVLLSGHHEAIRRWRASMALEETNGKRPDLFGAHVNPEANHG